MKKEKVYFLGFSLYYRNQQKIETSNIPIISIDHQKIKQKLIETQIINKKHHTQHVKIYFNLKPWYIIEKFRQKLEGLIHYYYEIISKPSKLTFYYYIYKFSCLKTLAYRKKISITQITKQFGKKLKMEYTIKKIKKNGNYLIETKIIHFPLYLEIMNLIGTKIINERKRRYKKQKLKKN